MTQAFEPLDRPAGLGEQVYLSLRTHLRNGSIAPGQPLQEVALAASLGVSRTPVREALARLASEGLLVSGGRSFTVPSLTLSDVNEIYEVRLLIEPAAIRRVARRTADRQARAAIEEALAAAARSHRAGDAAAFTDSNVRYRDAWLALVGNPHLVRVIERYADHVQQIRALTLGDRVTRTAVLGGLEAITAALREGDADRAASAMLEHLKRARQAFIAAIGLDRALEPEGSAAVGAKR